MFGLESDQFKVQAKYPFWPKKQYPDPKSKRKWKTLVSLVHQPTSFKESLLPNLFLINTICTSRITRNPNVSLSLFLHCEKIFAFTKVVERLAKKIKSSFPSWQQTSTSHRFAWPWFEICNTPQKIVASMAWLTKFLVSLF